MQEDSFQLPDFQNRPRPARTTSALADRIMDCDAKKIVELLDLSPHPEGGYFRESYRSEDTVDAGAISPAFSGKRSCSTAIYFLLSGNDFSAMHRIKSDEMWHYYGGMPVMIHAISPSGKLTVGLLGPAMASGQHFQWTVKAGCWFAAHLAPTPGTPLYADDYALVGCTVSPGFAFEDFEMGDRATLTATYPKHAWLISKLTR